MFHKPSLVLRTGIGKGVGFIFGLAGFLMLPWFMAEADLMLRWGILLWYTSLGAIIGVFGIYKEHPVLHLPFPWWVRAPAIGAWMNFVLSLFAYDRFAAIMTEFFGAEGLMTSPFWFSIEGAVIGLIIGGIATYFGGEGLETAGMNGTPAG